MLYFVKLFFAFSVPFTIMMSTMHILGYGRSSSVIADIIIGGIYGLLMTLVLGGLHRLKVRSLSDKRSKHNLDVVQQGTLLLALPYERAWDLCVQALGTLPRSTIEDADRAAGKQVARIGMSWSSWGEQITCDLKAVDAHTTQLTLVSRPTLKTTLLDYGKNLQNVEQIRTYLAPYRVNTFTFVDQTEAEAA